MTILTSWCFTMKPCPICLSSVSDDFVVCDCGFDFSKEEVGDRDKIPIHFAKFKKVEWAKAVDFKRRVHKIQCKKHGSVLPGPGSYGWSIEDTARLFDESKATISRDINLAEALERYSQLLECENKSSAQRRLQEIKRNPSGSRDSSKTRRNRTRTGTAAPYRRARSLCGRPGRSAL